jgi:hypothetical protein|eukprot:CAMPEP_0174288606 /NCGR_PEP_ID=MMETSP0809-20121228/21539_1 /TAXON_ID=73025 ORGANISM="Eutreptiella gymnastica-like, Strain CCMP1594" /NCGR_SAMPLE_ID=MMETSP0809 /ASSEMBLY_ACC=CAM_ASM_000658 /LENGTH=287 /DNA_ID=CAMNT_0015385955 /DNA_START=39 /DNA_END=902 /DNA_ORIENTATION=+
MIRGFDQSIDDSKYIQKWKDVLCAKSHEPRKVRFHDQASVASRFQNHNVTAAGPHYYSHWLACQQHLGAANEDCRKLRWWAEAMTQNRSKDEWDDWWKEEHFDLQIGQHWNKLTGDEFEEAAGVLKDLKEKREGLVTKLKELVKSNASEDPMGKIKQSIAEMEEVSENPVSDLVEAGTLSKDDAEAAAAAKIKQLKALQDDATWAEIKNPLVKGVAVSCNKLKIAAQLFAEKDAMATEEVKKRGEIKVEIPHMRVDYEKPGLYEYRTWFGQFIPRTPMYGFVEEEEE